MGTCDSPTVRTAKSVDASGLRQQPFAVERQDKTQAALLPIGTSDLTALTSDWFPLGGILAHHLACDEPRHLSIAVPLPGGYGGPNRQMFASHSAGKGQPFPVASGNLGSPRLAVRNGSLRPRLTFCRRCCKGRILKVVGDEVAALGATSDPQRWHLQQHMSTFSVSTIAVYCRWQQDGKVGMAKLLANLQSQSTLFGSSGESHRHAVGL